MTHKVHKQYIVFNSSESLLSSIAKDAVTFGFILLCIYVSQGSRWWTFFTGCMAIIFIIAQITGKERKIIIKNRQEALDWANSIEDDANNLGDQKSE